MRSKITLTGTLFLEQRILLDVSSPIKVHSLHDTKCCIFPLPSLGEMMGFFHCNSSPNLDVEILTLS